MPGNYALRPRDATVAEPDLLLDTDVLIEILRGSARANTWLEGLGNLTIGISVLTRMEVLQGARDRREQEILMGQLDNYHLVLLAASDSTQALNWFEEYYLSHGVGVIDCLIAASA
jgi:predicted nucleic acid-binding protein